MAAELVDGEAAAPEQPSPPPSPGNTRKRIALAVAAVAVLAAVGLGLMAWGLQGRGSRDTSAANADADAQLGVEGDEPETVDAVESAGANAAEAAAPASAAPPVAAAALPTETYDAVIVGGGWAGIRAAETLLAAGVASVLVLEANDYVGGRSKSVNPDGTVNDPSKVGRRDNSPVDMGSEWLYSWRSPMHRAFSKRGYLSPLEEHGDGPGTTPLETGAAFYQRFEDGTAALMEGANELMEEVWHNGFLRYRENRYDELEGLSYAQAIDNYIESAGVTDAAALQFLNLVEDGMEIEYTGDASQIGVEWIEFFPKGYASSSTEYLSVPGIGFGNVAAGYAAPLAAHMRLESRVTELDSDGEGTVVRYVRDGAERAVVAKTVLVTVSLGVLKAGSIKFVPSLPAWKQEVIDQMGFSIVNKCIMSWDHDEDIVWPRDHKWFVLMTPEDATSGHWTTFLNASGAKGRPVLTAWAGGHEAVALERLPDAEVLGMVLDNLRSMFPAVREPDRFVVSRWGSDKSFHGTYSFPVPGRAFHEDAENLGWPLEERAIWFAGEATGTGWGTTGGAWKTGESAAEAMAESLAGADGV